jgi:DNA-binding NarL/FixJ family response regulator
MSNFQRSQPTSTCRGTMLVVCLRFLGRRHREVLAARTEGRTHQQIADRLGIGRRTVSAYLADARARIRRHGRDVKQQPLR